MVADVPKRLRVRVLITLKSTDQLALHNVSDKFSKIRDRVIDYNCHRFRGLNNVIPAQLVSCETVLT